MSQIGAWLEDLRNQERRSYRLARAFFCPKNLAQSLHEKGTARVIQGGRIHRSWVEVYYPPVAFRKRRRVVLAGRPPKIVYRRV